MTQSKYDWIQQHAKPWDIVTLSDGRRLITRKRAHLFSDDMYLADPERAAMGDIPARYLGSEINNLPIAAIWRPIELPARHWSHCIGGHGFVEYKLIGRYFEKQTDPAIEEAKRNIEVAEKALVEAREQLRKVEK